MTHKELINRALDGKTQQELATQLGWRSIQFLSNISRGKSLIPPRKFKRFSQVTGVDVEVLIQSTLEHERERILRKMNGRS